LGLSSVTRDIIEQPFAHGRDGGGKESCREFDAAQSGTFHQTQPMVAGVFHFTHQIKIAGGSCHDAAILPAAHCRKAVEKPGLGNRSAISTFPPQPQQIQLLAVLLAQTLQTSPGGYNVTGLFQRRGGLD